jgi:hypothetical protein
MANNYSLSSTFYPVPADKQTKAEAILNRLAIEVEAEDMQLKPEDEGYEELEGYLSFFWEFIRLGDKEGLWIHPNQDEIADPDEIAEAISRLQVSLGATEPFHFSFAFTCSKHRVDEFGGGSVAVMPNGDIYFAGSHNDALQKAKEDHQFGKVVWTAEDIQSLRENMTDEEAEEFLKKNQNRIQDRLVELGWDIIETLLDEEGL